VIANICLTSSSHVGGDQPPIDACKGGQWTPIGIKWNE
jgi:hypothetical protein